MERKLSLTSTASRLSAALALAAVLLPPTAALAQTAAPQAAPPFNPTYGAPIAGVCVFSQTQAIGRSQAGVSAGGQLERLSQSVQSDLAAQRTALIAQGKALAAEKAKLSAAEYARRTSDLEQRAQAFDRLANTRSAQLRQTRTIALGQIGAAMTPILAASVTSHRCGLVLDAGATYGSNAAMDLTAGVVQKLNAKLPSVTVTLATPEQAGVTTAG
jgi:Skp family chaperone for outer membrane proteins